MRYNAVSDSSGAYVADARLASSGVTGRRMQEVGSRVLWPQRWFESIRAGFYAMRPRQGFGQRGGASCFATNLAFGRFVARFSPVLARFGTSKGRKRNFRALRYNAIGEPAMPMAEPRKLSRVFPAIRAVGSFGQAASRPHAWGRLFFLSRFLGSLTLETASLVRPKCSVLQGVARCV